jgi:hypothetical protein
MPIHFHLRRVELIGLGICAVATAGCSSSTNSDSASDDGAGSEIATSVVSGALNSGADSKVGFNEPQRSEPRRAIDWFLNQLNPIGTAHAADWSCSARTLDPPFAGPGTYTLTPGDCSVTIAGKTISADWSSTFSLEYGSACDLLHRSIFNQAASCSLTRTTDANGNARTFTGPDGGSYSVTHNTHGQGTGWDTTVSPAPTNAGVVTTCGAGGCASGFTLDIAGSHLLGNVSGPKGGSAKLWDHTVSTGTGGVTVSHSGTSMVASGTVIVQHNRAKFTSTTTFDSVTYADANCCFPTGGSVSTAFSSGPYEGKTETLTFSATGACGDAQLTRPDGTTASLTLTHCI